MANGFFYLNTSCALGSSSLFINKEQMDYVTLSTSLRDNKPIYLDTIVYIEYIKFNFADGTHAFVFAEDIEKISTLFEVAIDKFSFVNLNFIINKVNMIEYVIECDSKKEMNDKFIDFMVKKSFDGMDQNLIDVSSSNKEKFNLFFCFSIDYGILGVSSHPYIYPGNFIFMSKIDKDIITLAHELGHYFGLLHTFQSTGDLCDDTDDKHVDSEYIGTGLDPNCNNIMSYSKSEEPIENVIFTSNQKELISASMFMPSRFNQLKYNIDIKSNDIVSYSNNDLSRLISIEIKRVSSGQY